MDWYLDINGVSRHSEDPKNEVARALMRKYGVSEWNEDNFGVGVTAKDANKFYTLGGYNNSLGEPSYYAGGGYQRRFGNDFYIEPGLLAGVVTGYEDPVTPMLIPKLGLGIKDVGQLNLSYLPSFRDNPSVWTANLSIPFK